MYDADTSIPGNYYGRFNADEDEIDPDKPELVDSEKEEEEDDEEDTDDE